MTGWLLSVALFSVVMSATPGPNNLLLAASGARSGYWATAPAIGGTLLGSAVILIACSVGMNRLVTEAPITQTVMSAAASIYMLWLGWHLWNAGSADIDDANNPLIGLWTMSVFQVVNPKTWLASLTLVSGYLAARSPGGLAMDLVGVACFLTIVTISCSAWVLFGATVRRRLSAENARRFNRVLSVLAVATVVTFWL